MSDDILRLPPDFDGGIRAPGPTGAAWARDLAAMDAKWGGIVAKQREERAGRTAEKVAAWRAALLGLVAQQARITAEGKWVSEGPVDLLTIAGRGRRETIHCAILAWLFQPNGSHGLGDRMLRVLLDRAGIGGVGEAELRAVRVRTEVERGARRADILVSLPGHTVVVEAKVDAGESTDQCQDTWRLFRDDDGARFVFLTPTGRRPDTAKDDARAAFATLSFCALRDALAAALDETKDHAAGRARAAAAGYLDTLERQFPRSHPMQVSEKVAFYIENQKRIEEWAALKGEMQESADAFFRDLAGPFEKLARELGEDVRVYPDLDGNHPKFFFVQNGWIAPGKKGAPASVAFEWRRSTAAFDSAYSGIWTHKTDKPDYVALHDRISRALDASGLPKATGEGRTPWWPTWRYERPADGAWWSHLDTFRDQLVETMRERWVALAPVVDRALEQVVVAPVPVAPLTAPFTPEMTG